MRRSYTVMTLGLCTALFLSGCKKNQDSQAPLLPPQKTTMLKSAATAVPSKPVSSSAEKNRAEACYADLCEANNELALPHLFEKGTQATKDQEDYFTKNFQELLNSVIKERIKTSSKLLAEIKKHGDRFDKISFTESQKNLVRTILWIMQSKYLNIIEKEEIQNLINNTDFMKAYTFGVFNGPEDYFAKIYPDVLLAHAAKKESSVLLTLQSKVNTELNAPLIDLKFEAIQKSQREETLDKEDLSQLMNNSVAMRLIDFIMFKMPGLKDKLPLEDDTLKQIYVQANLPKKIQTQMNEAGSLEKTCKEKFIQTINLYPQEQEIKKFKKYAEVVRAMSLEVLGSQDKASNAIQKAVFHMPLDRNGIVNRWSKRLKDMKDSAVDEQKKYEVLDESSLILMAIINSMSGEFGENFCKDIADLHISDAALPIDSGIRVSWFSVKHPEYGTSILAHEIGHVVSHASENLAKTKLCLKEKQNSEKFVEEDFADYFAAKVMDRLKNDVPGGHKNFACTLASDNRPSLQAQSADTHSSGLYRALQIATMSKQSIPESCQQLVKADGSKALNMCE